ncbi:nicotinate-nucleotide--dimethylbenzimidazole phosphoribosyltransferase [Dyella sp. LX-66]|uniref:nicotinate-nucleotide--dimethylbenzimidazole phosphoribosyltransferase n=1 Tax=unclassified Dyella TaxID=2634549 RepID=UPI001BDF9A1C|nr:MULTISPECIES: nicotinate-nucleotide--dimethylbenzimidazole phosphoribosyltransferase [unclassified Dyella]MBT2115538.1 nicotinate-nucleotide--dimethylbenzimidazole phosphoribosyltransferase [Dyella sp. LX-1]MBT2139353.1 nicotinate-nucleotide--dimethylbenzimidazole phosphoribosyltransferase [Dyella sp. LX-66]
METLDWLDLPCRAPDAVAAVAALERQAQLTKPPGSLGALEAAAVQLAALQGAVKPSLEKVWISVFAADHGVAEEGVSAFPQAVTGAMVANFAQGGAAISVLARELGASLEVVNLGTVNDVGELPGVRRAWIAAQTANFAQGEAMSPAQLALALQAGAQSVQLADEAGAQLFIGGEMGIGNTTAATALACALLDEAPDALAGAGTGLDEAGVARKAAVVQRALALHREAATPIAWLRCVGGFELAALAGAYIAAAQRGMPVLVDGFITSAAALVAARLQPACRPWMLFSHRSQERGHARLLEALEAGPLLDLQLRLGEASGAAVAVPLLRLACALHAGMATFAEAGVAQA